jgi:hypothetical protein
MLEIIRFASCCVTLIGVSVTAALIQPEWAPELCLSRWAPDNALSGEQQQSAELDKINQAEKRRVVLRIAMTRRLMNNSVTLFETAALFHQLNQEWRPDFVAGEFPGCSSEEAACRQVITWVQKETQQGDGQLVQRLEEDLRRHKEQHGRVILPEVDRASAKYQSDGFSLR